MEPFGLDGEIGLVTRSTQKVDINPAALAFTALVIEYWEFPQMGYFLFPGRKKDLALMFGQGLQAGRVPLSEKHHTHLQSPLRFRHESGGLARLSQLNGHMRPNYLILRHRPFKGRHYRRAHG